MPTKKKKTNAPPYESCSCARSDDGLTVSTVWWCTLSSSSCLGFVGLNNLKNTDYVNVVIQALAHVIPVRNYFLQPPVQQRNKTQLVRTD